MSVVIALLLSAAAPEAANDPRGVKTVQDALAALEQKPRKGFVAATPLGNPGDWVRTSDYPAEALRNSQQGNVQFKLAISNAGLVTDCQIAISSGSPSLDAATCSLITQRARFSPARDAKGRPTTGTYANTVRWVIPKGEPRPGPQATDMEASVVYGADGKPNDCKVIKAGPVPPFDKVGPIACPAAIIPYTNAWGNPVARRVVLIVKNQVLPVD